MTPKTEQEFFNETYARIVAQGKPGGRVQDTGGFECLYLALDGTKCAAGQWLGDEYTPGMEGKSVENLCRMWLPEGHVLNTFKWLAQDCQYAHDNAARLLYMNEECAPDEATFLEVYRDNMKSLAVGRGLVMPGEGA